MFVGHSDPRADLSFVVKPLNRIAPHTHIERPLLMRRPLILQPKFLSSLNVLVGRLPRNHWSGRRAAAVIKRKQLRRIVRPTIVELHTPFDQMLTVGYPGMVQAEAAGVGHSFLVRGLS